LYSIYVLPVCHKVLMTLCHMEPQLWYPFQGQGSDNLELNLFETIKRNKYLSIITI
jgi:hypothetical protein